MSHWSSSHCHLQPPNAALSSSQCHGGDRVKSNTPDLVSKAQQVEKAPLQLAQGYQTPPSLHASAAAPHSPAKSVMKLHNSATWIAGRDILLWSEEGSEALCSLLVSGVSLSCSAISDVCLESTEIYASLVMEAFTD